MWIFLGKNQGAGQAVFISVVSEGSFILVFSQLRACILQHLILTSYLQSQQQ
jgi:hypothetical protein